MRGALLLCAIIVVALSGGCATLITGAGHDQAIKFRTSPPGASVFVDDTLVGKTPMTWRVARDEHHKVRLELAGYRTEMHELSPGLNAWIFGNAIFGGVIGLVIDTFSGAAICQYPGSWTATLMRDQSAPPAVAPDAVT